MNLSLPQLEAMADELADALAGGIVREVRQPGPTRLWLRVRVPGTNLDVLFETRSPMARMHLTYLRPTTLAPPPAFLAKTRAELTGARVVRVHMPWPDRVVVLEFAKAGTSWSLVFEASGHHANLFLVKDRCLLIAMGLRPSDSHRRSLIEGRRYEPPPPRPPGRKEARTPDPMPVTSADIEAHYEEQERAAELAATFQQVKSTLNRTRKRVARTLKKVAADRASALAHRESRHLGELLKMNLHLAKRGLSALEVTDVFDPESRVMVIPLQPELDGRQNMERLFARYKKGVRAEARIDSRLGCLRERDEALEAFEEELGSCTTLAELAALSKRIGNRYKPLAAELTAIGGTRGGATRRRQERHRPYREFLSANGRKILVGRGGVDNHALTFQVASPHDAWLHARGVAGSHVVIPLARGQEPDPDTLLDAAHLAIRYSKASGTDFCEVMWTRRKHVRAVRKGKPGQVIVEQDANLAFEFDDSRMVRLAGAR